MCGIAGWSGSYPRELLGRMAKTISHRGPDDEGTELVGDGRAGLVHRRLSIIDLSPAGHQPMWDAEHSTAIVYNGELYNFREIRAELEADGFRFRSQSDTEVLLQLYRRDGEKMLERLNGIFAFAIWDDRKRCLFIARDPLGVKPLYYTRTAHGLLFASEIKALLQSGDVDRTLDLGAIDRHMHLLWSPAPDTALANVKKLEPGCALRVRDGFIERSWRYYSLPYDQEIDDSLSEARAADELRERITLAVERQLVADVPIGAFLSGGLDSSSVVALAARAMPRGSLRCFTIGFRDPAAQREGMGDDLPYAERVANHLGVKLDTVWVGSEMADRLAQMIFHLDEPQGDPAPINALMICELAREQGIRVLLSGAGGDDLFTGYRRHTALLAERAWRWLPRSARRALRVTSQAFPLNRRLAKAFAFADEDQDARIAGYFDWAPRGATHDLFSPEVRHALAGRDALSPLLDALSALPANVPALNRMLYLESRYFLADHNLNYTDKMGMARGVEVRVPLLDPDVVSFAARLPLSLKQRGATGKWILKRAMRSMLPPDVIDRPKVGFGAPMRSWLAGPLAGLVDDVLSESSIKRRGLFDPKSVRSLTERDRSGRADGAYTLFSLVCVELWCRMFVDGGAPASLVPGVGL